LQSTKYGPIRAASSARMKAMARPSSVVCTVSPQNLWLRSSQCRRSQPTRVTLYHGNGREFIRPRRAGKTALSFRRGFALCRGGRQTLAGGVERLDGPDIEVGLPPRWARAAIADRALRDLAAGKRHRAAAMVEVRHILVAHCKAQVRRAGRSARYRKGR